MPAMHVMNSPFYRMLLSTLAAVLIAPAFAQPTGESPQPEPSTSAESAEDAPSPDLPEVAPPTAAAAIPGIRSGAVVAVIPIEKMIYDFTLESLERRVERARALGATVIVIELDTPGGVAASAQKISKYLKALDLPTIAWVNNEAYSGGIMIAAACDAIVMSASSATGDCAPIVPGMDLSPTERAKALSPILTEFRDSAQQNGYDFSLFHAMCVLEIEVFQVEHKTTGQRRSVNQADYAVMVEGADPQNVAAPGDWVNRVMGSFTGSPQNQVGAPTVQVATETDRGQWRLVRRVHDGQTLLTLTQSEAIDVGLAVAIVSSEAELMQLLGAASITAVRMTWSEQLARFLTHPLTRVVLVMALLVGGYFELQAPGLGIGGAIALLALAGLLGGPLLAGLAQVWHIVVFLIGVVLLLIELFVLPGFGVFGVAGLVLMFLGLALSVVPSGLPAAQRWGALQQSVLWLLLGVFFSGIGFVFLTRYFGSVPIFTRLMLANPDPADLLPPGAAAPHVSGDEAVGAGRIAQGQVGRIVSPLRPIGRAEIEGQLVDVISEGDWLEVGQKVRVVSVQGNRIAVERA